MSAVSRVIISPIYNFFADKRKRRLFYLAIICLLALGEFLLSGLVRRTLIFYSIDGKSIIEERMLRQSQDRETDIRRYIEEVLLGPSSPDTAPLFHRETQLRSFMYRDGIVYADFTEQAALPLGDSHDVFRSLFTLNQGVRRNFPQVKDVRLFIGGNEVFFEEFRRFFTNSADNRKTTP